eukprot:55525_1
MTNTGSEVFLLQCSLCGAKFSQSGQVVGGYASCDPHKYGPIGGPVAQPPPAKNTSMSPRGIVYPTDSERNWLILVDENKSENEDHTAQLMKDIEELNKNKTTSMTVISTMIKTLRVKLDERHDELEKELTLAYKERCAKIQENIQILKAHKVTNIEAKENSEDLLVGNQKVKDREQIIVGQCESVIQNTPNLKYIETELRYTFDQFEAIERRLSKFGVLHTKPIHSGIKCIFQSAINARNPVSSAKQEVTVPALQLRNTAFDENKQRVKLGFKVRQDANDNKDLDVKVLDHLHIHVLCQQEMDDDGKVDELQPIYDDYIALKDCELNKNGKKYELYVPHKFNAGVIEFKIQAKFTSPDEDKYASGEGKWSRAQSAEIPEDEEDDKEIFYLEFNGRTQRLSLDGDDAALAKFSKFEKKFKKKFSVDLKQNQKLMLRTKDGVELNEKSKLMTLKRATPNEFVVEGRIVSTQQPDEPPKAYSKGPQAMSPNAVASLASRNAKQSVAAEVFSPQAAQVVSPNGKDRRKKPPRGGAGAGAQGNKKASGDAKKAGPKQIASIAVFGDTKKRVVLKNNPKKDVYEYTIPSLKEKILKKFQKTGLKGQFTLSTEDGSVIELDEHIIKYLVDYKGEIKVSIKK